MVGCEAAVAGANASGSRRSHRSTVRYRTDASTLLRAAFALSHPFSSPMARHCKDGALAYGDEKIDLAPYLKSL
jgi:hypothetical protein